MDGNWREVYQNLKGFIDRNEGIEINPNSVCIPGDARLEFYRLFDDVNGELIRRHFTPELAKARALSESWQGLSEQLSRDLGLLSIDVPLYLKWFLADHVDGLIRTLFDPLFDVLKGKMALEDFEPAAVVVVKRAFERYYREGYRYWVIVALIKALAPVRLLQVKGQDIYNEANLSDSGGGIGTPLGEAPEPEEAKTISFVEAPVHAFLTPRIIVYSTRLKTFVSLRPDFHESSWNSRTYSEKQEWLDMPAGLHKADKSRLWPNLVVHTAEDVHDLCFVADYSRVARPEVTLEVKETADWYEKEGLESIRRHHDFLKPKRGTFVACFEAVPEKARQELISPSEPQLHAAAGVTVSEPSRAGAIQLLYTDYDAKRLEPVLEALGG